MLNKEMMMKIMSYVEVETARKNTERMTMVIDAVEDLGKASSNYSQEELVLHYINFLAQNRNSFFGRAKMDSIRVWEMAEDLYQEDEDLGNIIELLNNNDIESSQVLKLWQYSTEKMEMGLGKDVDEKCIEKYISSENFSMVQTNISWLIQKPFSPQDTALFLVSGLTVKELLDKHREDLGQNIISWFTLGRENNQINEYVKFKKEQDKLKTKKQLADLRKAKRLHKLQEVQA